MTNYEHYKWKLENWDYKKDGHFCDTFTEGIAGISCKAKTSTGFGLSVGGCAKCTLELYEWLNKEYIEPVDWETLPEDTKVLVSDNGNNWFKRYFHRYEGCNSLKYITFADGRDSWSKANADDEHWKYCKLWKEN